MAGPAYAKPKRLRFGEGRPPEGRDPAIHALQRACGAADRRWPGKSKPPPTPPRQGAVSGDPHFVACIAPLSIQSQPQVCRRNRERRKGRIRGQCRGIDHPSRLAGAARPGLDRGDGMRHPGDLPAPRFSARNHRERYCRFCGRRSVATRDRGSAPRASRPSTHTPSVRRTIFGAPDGLGLCRAVSAFGCPRQTIFTHRRRQAIG
jgi:hypothetical protein